MSKWQWLRLVLWTVTLVVVGFFLFSQLPWWKYGRLDYAGIARQGAPLVEATYRFRQERGLWPEYLDELDGYLTKGQQAEAAGWEYVPGVRFMRWLKTEGRSEEVVTYDFDPGVWRLKAYDGLVRAIDVKQALPGPTTLPAKQVMENMLKELDKRIARDSQPAEYYRMKASALLAMGREAEARETVAAALKPGGNVWWPVLANAVLEARGGAGAAAAAKEALAKWVEANPGFTRPFYLAVFCRETGDKAGIVAALNAMKERLKKPEEAELRLDDPWSTEAYLFDASRMAYAGGDYALVVELCNIWAGLKSSRDTAEPSYFALRAAAELALGQKESALSDAKAAVARNTPATPLWAQNLGDLRKAAEAGNVKYVYDPGDTPRRFEVFSTEGMAVPASAPAAR